MAERRYIITYFDVLYCPEISELSDEDFGRLMRLYIEYANTREKPNVPSALFETFTMLRMDADRHERKRLEKSKKARASAAARWMNNANNANDANAPNAKNAYNYNYNHNDNYNDSYNENTIGYGHEEGSFNVLTGSASAVEAEAVEAPTLLPKNVDEMRDTLRVYCPWVDDAATWESFKARVYPNIPAAYAIKAARELHAKGRNSYGDFYNAAREYAKPISFPPLDEGKSIENMR